MLRFYYTQCYLRSKNIECLFFTQGSKYKDWSVMKNILNLLYSLIGLYQGSNRGEWKCNWHYRINLSEWKIIQHHSNPFLKIFQMSHLEVSKPYPHKAMVSSWIGHIARSYWMGFRNNILEIVSMVNSFSFLYCKNLYYNMHYLNFCDIKSYT